ncbi:hypothetical protein MWLp12_2859 [Lactiplantibacillus plantarum]|nr:hypothetical protein Nizo2264_2875 [Lactiplantibacillus plantarum]WCL70210.1 hypothetical protein MWLp12_2859 [Lactiplantibacillus plantarum]
MCDKSIIIAPFRCDSFSLIGFDKVTMVNPTKINILMGYSD